MTTIQAHFDGQVFVPEGAVQFPVGARLQLVIEELPASAAPAPDDLALEPFIGMWRDRAPQTDNTDWVRQTRRQEWGEP